MAKLTDRYENKNLINLAKNKYEQKQKSGIPAEIVTLTSQGKVYPETSPLRSGKIEMRYMTAYDEDILTNNSYITEGVVLDKLLEALIVTDIDINEIAQVDKDGLVLNARILSYGADYNVQVTDPKTKNVIKRTIDLSKIKTKTIDIESDERGEFLYETESLQIKFKFPTSTQSNKTKTISEYLSNSITEINGKRKQSEIDQFIRYEFLVKDSKQFQNYIIENTPSIILEYEFEGEDGGAFTAGFPIGPDFFWI
jgi:hypothetical protein